MKEGTQFIPLDQIGTQDEPVMIPGTGVVLGKFYPPHKGHKFLIETAQAKCNALSVVVCTRANETIPGGLRHTWVKEIHPKAFVRRQEHTYPDNDSKLWAKVTVDWLHFIPEFAFSSEDYGQRWAEFMGNTHVLVDKARAQVPISGTKVRENPQDVLQFLEPNVAAYFNSEQKEAVAVKLK